MNRLATVLAATALTLGCGDDAFSPSGVAGTYTLRSANGISLPATVDFGGGEIVTVNSGSVTLNENGTWTSTITATDTEGTETETSSGTFTLIEPNTVRFTEVGDPDVFTAVIDGNRITVIVDGVVSLVFEK